MSQQMYSTTELAAMTPDELREAQAHGFVKPGVADKSHIAKDLGPSHPSSPQDPYAVTTWGEKEYDFVVPSGQRCRMVKIQPEEFIGEDLLDRITRLPGLAEEEIRKAEGKPPVPAMPSKEQLAAIIEVVNELVPMVVVRPKVWPLPAEGEERVEGRVYVDDIELFDRIAIMNRATEGVAKMDNFREES